MRDANVYMLVNGVQSQVEKIASAANQANTYLHQEIYAIKLNLIAIRKLLEETNPKLFSEENVVATARKIHEEEKKKDEAAKAAAEAAKANPAPVTVPPVKTGANA